MPPLGVPSDPGAVDRVGVFFDWVTRCLGRGMLDASIADKLIKAGTGFLQSAKAYHSHRELEEMRLLVKRAEQATRAADFQEIKSRYGAK